jgi:hypothetical protein
MDKIYVGNNISIAYVGNKKQSIMLFNNKIAVKQISIPDIFDKKLLILEAVDLGAKKLSLQKLSILQDRPSTIM